MKITERQLIVLIDVLKNIAYLHNFSIKGHDTYDLIELHQEIIDQQSDDLKEIGEEK